MPIADANVVSIDAARALIAPTLSAQLAARDLQVVLNDELGLGGDDDRSGVLLVPEGALIAGDLRLDHGAAVHDGRAYRGILALGGLLVEGDIVNDTPDGGPFLVVLGCLSVRHIIKGGSPLIVFGPLVSPGIIYCHYNRGTFRAYGGIAAQGIILDDDRYDIAGPVSGVKLVMREDDAAHFLRSEFFHEDDDGTVEPIDDLNEALKQHIRAGAPIFRDDAPVS